MSLGYGMVFSVSAAIVVPFYLFFFYFTLMLYANYHSFSHFAGERFWSQPWIEQTLKSVINSTEILHSVTLEDVVFYFIVFLIILRILKTDLSDSDSVDSEIIADKWYVIRIYL